MTSSQQTDTTKKNIYLGMSIKINNQTIVLAPKTPINKIKKDGLELELPRYVYLGKVGDEFEKLMRSFMPENSSSITVASLKTNIQAIDNLVKKVAEADITLGKFHLQIYPEEGEEKPPNRYTVALLANWPESSLQDDNKVGGFKITGLFVMVTNEEETGTVDAGEAIKEAAARIQQRLAAEPKPLAPVQTEET